jgi:hypothetical protein
MALLCGVAVTALSREPLEAPATAAEVEDAIRLLESAKDKTTRSQAITRLKDYAQATAAGQAIAALERCAGDEPDSATRGQALVALALIAHHQKQPCPLTLVAALLDKDDEVRGQAMNCLGLFESFPRGAVELLLRGMDSEDRLIRSECVMALGHCGKDKKVLAAIEKAQADQEFLVRHNARVAAFRATKNLEDYLRYLIRLEGDAAAILSPVPKDVEARQRDEVVRNLVLLGATTGMLEWSEDRAGELAPLLMRLLDDKDPILRRGAARQIALSAVKIDRPKDGTGRFDWVEYIMPYIEQDPATRSAAKKAESPKPPQPSKLALQLAKLKAADRLQQLASSDPDETARLAAGQALERLERVLYKKP